MSNRQAGKWNEQERQDDCDHIAIVSISETECGCMDCMRVWDKKPGFQSDWPQFDRG